MDVAGRFTATSLRPTGHGTSDTHNRDGSVAHSRWLYDDAGRLAESNFWLNDEPIKRVVCSYDEVGRHVRTVQLSPDGTQTDLEICSYDVGGKKTKVHFLSPRGADAHGIEGTEHAYGAPEATMMTTSTRSSSRARRSGIQGGCAVGPGGLRALRTSKIGSTTLADIEK